MSRSTLAAAALLLAGICGCADSPTEPDPKSSGDAGPPRPALRIDLRVDNAVVKDGADAGFTAFLVNDGAEPVTVVLPGDGSDCGWRSPVVRWHPEQQHGARCGNINRLRDNEVVTLAAGERVRLGWLGRPHLVGPGTHQVQLELEHIPDLEWGGVPLGEHSPTAMARLRQTPAFKAVSNVVEVTVRP
jgi:hypothetical protein